MRRTCSHWCEIPANGSLWVWWLWPRNEPLLSVIVRSVLIHVQLNGFFCCEANWFCAVRMSIARWISCFIAMVCGFGHVQYCTSIMNSWMRSFALAVHVLLVTNCKLFVGKWLRPRYIRLRVKWVCCDSIMHDAEADFDVNRIVLVIIFHALCMCTHEAHMH